MWNMCGTCEEMENVLQVLIDRSNYVMERNHMRSELSRMDITAFSLKSTLNSDQYEVTKYLFKFVHTRLYVRI